MKKSIKDYNYNEKKVILRCDLNVPMKNNIIEDDTRIKQSLKTINYLIENNAKVIILSHLGKIKEESDLEKNNLYPVSIRLGELLNKEVIFIDETRGEKLESAVNNLKPKEVLLVQNTRYEDLYDNKESNCDSELSKYWASLGDIFINDAYATLHRSHASNVGIAKYLPSAVGFLIEEELNKIDNFLNKEEHPFTVIMGGAKVKDKIKLIENLINKCDKLIIGGLMAYTFLYASEIKVGKTQIDEESIDFCKEMLIKHKDKIILPIDSLVSTDINSNNYENKFITDINSDELALDIGEETIKLYKEELKESKKVLINGPLGYFEKETYANGTKEVFNYIAENNILCLVGGGDSASAVNKLCDPQKFYHISTGGGATLKYLEGTKLAGLESINDID